MPAASHPQAKFDPVPPDLDFGALVEKTSNFDYVVRISIEQIDELGLAEFEKLVLLHVVIGGKPLVVEGWQRKLPPWIFNTSWLQENVGRKEEIVRDIGNSSNMRMTIGHYLGALEKLTRQWTPQNIRDPKRQRLYLKDIDCPGEWHNSLEKLLPQAVFYLNESVGERGGPGSQNERNHYSQATSGKGIASAGDLMSNLPPEMRAENMMCYIGHEGTYTPAHREMCATLGQNVMVETSAFDNGEKPGSSIWFMTESKDREVVSEYFLSMLGHDVEVEKHFAQINAWKKAPFPVYIVEQKVGDLILIPPLAPHQVWNRGMRTMKAAWNRTTVETLELALREALPRARMVCRDEQYKCKAIVYYSLLEYSERLRRVQAIDQHNYGTGQPMIRQTPRIKQLRRDFRRLFILYTEILVSESYSPEQPEEQHAEFVEFDSNITCSYCRCNIFNKFLTCKTCVGELADGEEDTYDICMECYAMGRSCACISNLTWVEQWEWSTLTRKHEEWRELIITNDQGYVTDKTPPTLEAARQRNGKKSVAQVCQEQLKIRPWKDINKAHDPEKPSAEPESEPELEVNNESSAKKKKSKRKSIPANAKDAAHPCHVCIHKEWKWKLAICTKCSSGYCYGVLWRAFDLKPQDVMENPQWVCPKCRNICSCGKCRKDPKQKSYTPKGTLLGHDTKKVADARSVESLVDFSRTNLNWLKEEGDNDPKNSARMQKLKDKADNEKAQEPVLEDDHAVALEHPASRQIDTEVSTLDPMLGSSNTGVHSNGHIVNGLREGRDGSFTLSQSVQDYGAGEGGLQIPFEPLTYDGASKAAQAPMISGSVYPDPSIGHLRMMGQGYYQQQPGDINPILFDHPDAANSGSQPQDMVYPRAQNDGETHGKTKKRPRDTDMTYDDKVDDAHEEYLRAQKRQRLNEARKNGEFYKFKNQLEGGSPLVVKLPLANHKEFLRGLLDLESGPKIARHNPRPGRSSISGLRLATQDEDAVVTSDVQGIAKQRSVYQEISDDDEEEFADSSVVVSSKIKQSVPVKPNIKHPNDTVSSSATAQAEESLPKTAKKRGRKPKSLDNSQPPPVEQPKLVQPVSQPEKHRTSEIEEPSEEVPHTEFRKEPTSEKSCRSVTFSEETPREDTPEQNIRSPMYSSFSSSDEDQFTSMDKDDYHPKIKGPPGLTQKLSTKVQSSVPDSYVNAKLEALRQAEEEIAEEKAAKTISKTLPPAPKGQMLSMAERKALAGKTIKITSAKSVNAAAKNTIKPATEYIPRTGAVASMAPVRNPKLTSPVATEDDSSSSDDDDRGIPSGRSPDIVVSGRGRGDVGRGLGRGRGRGRGRPRGRLGRAGATF